MQSDLRELSDQQLFERASLVSLHERRCTVELIRYLMEIERRRLWAGRACASAYGYLLQRGYSESSALKRSRIAKLALHLPQVFDELEARGQHVTGLFRLSKYLTPDNVDSLLAAARGLKCKEIDALIASRFPRPDVPDLIAEIVEDPAPPLPLTSPEPARSGTCPKTGGGANADVAGTDGPPATHGSPDTGESDAGESDAGASTERLPAVTSSETGHDRIEPLSATRYLVQFTVGAEFVQLLQRARELTSHAIPSGTPAAIIGRSLRELVQRAEKRLIGAGKPRKQPAREPDPESRVIPVDVQRAVRLRDGDRCTFTDEHGNRCEERCFLTVEHCDPHARRGPTTPANCCLLCKTHNLHRAREVFGDDYIDNKIAAQRERQRVARRVPEAYAKAHRALVNLGYQRREVDAVLATVRQRLPSDADLPTLLRAALPAFELPR